MQRLSQLFKTGDNDFQNLPSSWGTRDSQTHGCRPSLPNLSAKENLTRQRPHSNQQGEPAGGDKRHTGYQRNNMIIMRDSFASGGLLGYRQEFKKPAVASQEIECFLCQVTMVMHIY